MSNELELEIDQKALDDLLATANQELELEATPEKTEEQSAPVSEEPLVTPSIQEPTAALNNSPKALSLTSLKQYYSKKLLLVTVLLLILVTAGSGFLGYKMAHHNTSHSPLQRIVDQGITFEEKNFVNCAGRGEKELVTDFLAAGMSVDALRPTDGWSPLISACFFKKADIAKLLLENQATVNLQDKYGRTALMQATVMGSEEIVTLLLENGANPNLQDKYGRTALMEAYLKHHAQIAEILRSAGADPNIMPPKNPEKALPVITPPLKEVVEPPTSSSSIAEETHLSIGKAGFIKIGMPLADVQKKYPSLVMKEQYVEGVKRTVANIYLNGPSNTPSLQLELSSGKLKIVSTISTYDERFSTDKQITVKSTVDDIRNQYSVNDVKVIDNSIFLVVKGMKMLFELDLTKNTVLSEWLDTGNPKAIPGDIKIKRIVSY